MEKNVMSGKKLAILLVAVSLLVAAGITAFMFVLMNREGITTSSGTFTNQRISSDDGSWRVSLERGNGHSRIDYTLSRGELSNLRINSTNSGGTVTFTLIQGSTDRIIELTGGFDGSVDTSGFEPGRVRFRLDFGQVEDLEFVVRWD